MPLLKLIQHDGDNDIAHDDGDDDKPTVQGPSPVTLSDFTVPRHIQDVALTVHVFVLLMHIVRHPPSDADDVTELAIDARNELLARYVALTVSTLLAV